MASPESAAEIEIDVLPGALVDRQEQQARRMFASGMRIREIADELGWNRNRVTRVMKRLYAADGLELPDGRAARWRKLRDEDFDYVRISESAYMQWQAGESLLEIARLNQVCDMTAKKAVEYRAEQHGLPVPDVEARRKDAADKAVELLQSGVSLNDVAKRLGKTTVTIRSWFNKWYAKRNLPCPDLRTTRRKSPPAA